MSEESDSGLLKGLKEKIGEKFDKAGEIKNSIVDKVSDIKDKGGEHLSTIKEHGSDQLASAKNEAVDLKRIFQSKDLVYRKSDAMAIVLRKLGNIDGFLDVVEQLTKEGYRLVHQRECTRHTYFCRFQLLLWKFLLLPTRKIYWEILNYPMNFDRENFRRRLDRARNSHTK